MENEINFSVLVKVQYMYDFLMKNAYQGLKGIVSFVISIGALVLYLKGFGGNDDFMNSLLIIIAALMIFNPVYLYYKAYKQVKLNKSFLEPLNYKVNNDGITVGQGTEQGTIPWDAVTYVVETRMSILVYLSKRSAYIFPKAELGENYDVFKQMIREHVEANHLKKMR